MDAIADPSSLPKWQQISEMLIREIAAGHLVDGARLPPEREMATGLGIAVGTLRKALAELEAQGLLERVHGSGNYVRAGQADSVYAFFRLERVSGGGLPTARVLSVTRMTKPASLPIFGTSMDAHRIRRVRMLDGEPAALEEIWLDASYAASIAPDDLSESLYLFYKRQLGLRITRVEDQIGVDALPDWGPEGFGLSAGTPCGWIERVSFDQDGARAEVSQTWFDNNKVRYINRLG